MENSWGISGPRAGAASGGPSRGLSIALHMLHAHRGQKRPGGRKAGAREEAREGVWGVGCVWGAADPEAVLGKGGLQAHSLGVEQSRSVLCLQAPSMAVFTSMVEHGLREPEPPD